MSFQSATQGSPVIMNGLDASVAGFPRVSTLAGPPSLYQPTKPTVQRRAISPRIQSTHPYSRAGTAHTPSLADGYGAASSTPTRPVTLAHTLSVGHALSVQSGMLTSPATRLFTGQQQTPQQPSSSSFSDSPYRTSSTHFIHRMSTDPMATHLEADTLHPHASAASKARRLDAEKLTHSLRSEQSMRGTSIHPLSAPVSAPTPIKHSLNSMPMVIMSNNTSIPAASPGSSTARTVVMMNPYVTTSSSTPLQQTHAPHIDKPVRKGDMRSCASTGRKGQEIQQTEVDLPMSYATSHRTPSPVCKGTQSPPPQPTPCSTYTPREQLIVMLPHNSTLASVNSPATFTHFSSPDISAAPLLAAAPHARAPPSTHGWPRLGNTSDISAGFRTQMNALSTPLIGSNRMEAEVHDYALIQTPAVSHTRAPTPVNAATTTPRDDHDRVMIAHNTVISEETTTSISPAKLEGSMQHIPERTLNDFPERTLNDFPVLTTFLRLPGIRNCLSRVASVYKGSRVRKHLLPYRVIIRRALRAGVRVCDSTRMLACCWADLMADMKVVANDFIVCLKNDHGLLLSGLSAQAHFDESVKKIGPPGSFQPFRVMYQEGVLLITATKHAVAALKGYAFILTIFEHTDANDRQLSLATTSAKKCISFCEDVVFGLLAIKSLSSSCVDCGRLQASLSSESNENAAAPLPPGIQHLANVQGLMESTAVDASVFLNDVKQLSQQFRHRLSLLEGLTIRAAQQKPPALHRAAMPIPTEVSVAEASSAIAVVGLRNDDDDDECKTFAIPKTPQIVTFPAPAPSFEPTRAVIDTPAAHTVSSPQQVLSVAGVRHYAPLNDNNKQQPLHRYVDESGSGPSLRAAETVNTDAPTHSTAAAPPPPIILSWQSPHWTRLKTTRMAKQVPVISPAIAEEQKEQQPKAQHNDTNNEVSVSSVIVRSAPPVLIEEMVSIDREPGKSRLETIIVPTIIAKPPPPSRDKPMMKKKPVPPPKKPQTPKSREGGDEKTDVAETKGDDRISKDSEEERHEERTKDGDEVHAYDAAETTIADGTDTADTGFNEEGNDGSATPIPPHLRPRNRGIRQHSENHHQQQYYDHYVEQEEVLQQPDHHSYYPAEEYVYGYSPYDSTFPHYSAATTSVTPSVVVSEAEAAVFRGPRRMKPRGLKRDDPSLRQTLRVGYTTR